MKTTNLNNGAEVKNEVLTFKASIYQLDKKDNVSFELITSGTTDKTNESLFNAVAQLLAKRTFQVFEHQNNICKVTNKHRVYKFAAGKPVYFYFQLNNETIIETELFSSLKVKLSGLDNAEQLQTILSSLITIMKGSTEVIL